jgi:RecA-family ATPase
LWEGRIPLGAITVLAGDPGLGKSLLSLRLAADLTHGRLIHGQAGNALLLTAEDALAYTVRPRLEAAGADLTRVHAPSLTIEGLEEPFLIPDHARRLQAMIEEREAKLVVIDPLVAFLAGKIDSWKDSSVRQALAPLSKVAEQTGAGVLVIAHLNKGSGDDPLQRLGGSIGIAAAARSVLLLGRNPNDPNTERGSKRVLAQVKTNLGEPSKSLAYTITPVTVREQQAATIEETGLSPYSGRDLLAQPRPKSRDWRRADARELLTQQLETGPKLMAELERAAESQGISRETLVRARKELGIESSKAGRGWIWHYPDQPITHEQPAEA